MAAADDLHISPFREDGKTYGTPTWVWSVAVDGDLYVRSYNGQNSSSYKAAMKQKAGRITAAGMTKEVSYREESVSVDIEEISSADWAEIVYRPDTVVNSARLYKKPGYKM